jgi:LysR family nitrogen assimilation transcriptional regulator
MNFHQLRYFAKVVETGSFTAAAKALHVSQPALGMQIRKLEDELGTELLHRHSRGIVPTEAGRLMTDHAMAILAHAERARQEIIDLSAAPRGTVGLGVTPTVGRVLVPGLLDRIAVELPGVTLILSEGLSEEVTGDVASGRLDLAFSYNRNAAAGLQCRPLLSENLYFIGARGAGVDVEDSISFAELCRYPLILPSRPHGIRVLLEDTAARSGVSLDVTLEIDSISMEREMIESGRGYTVLPHGVVGREIAQGILFAREITEPALPRTLYLVAPAKRRRSRAAEAVQKLINIIVADATAAGRWHWKPV